MEETRKRLGLWVVLIGLSTSVCEATAEISKQAVEAREALSEVSPTLIKVEAVKGDPFIEIFVSGTSPSSCYDVHEYVIEKDAQATRVIPRFRKSKLSAPCSKNPVAFQEKAADLDPHVAESYKVEVLGYYGWIKITVPREGK